jgi:hypothetical protein
MIERVRVAGCRPVGSGIAEVMARARRDVVVVERDQTAVAPGAPGARGANPDRPPLHRSSGRFGSRRLETTVCPRKDDLVYAPDNSRTQCPQKIVLGVE